GRGPRTGVSTKLATITEEPTTPLAKERSTTLHSFWSKLPRSDDGKTETLSARSFPFFNTGRSSARNDTEIVNKRTTAVKCPVRSVVERGLNADGGEEQDKNSSEEARKSANLKQRAAEAFTRAKRHPLVEEEDLVEAEKKEHGEKSSETSIAEERLLNAEGEHRSMLRESAAEEDFEEEDDTDPANEKSKKIPWWLEAQHEKDKAQERAVREKHSKPDPRVVQVGEEDRGRAVSSSAQPSRSSASSASQATAEFRATSSRPAMKHVMPSLRKQLYYGMQPGRKLFHRMANARKKYKLAGRDHVDKNLKDYRQKSSSRPKSVSSTPSPKSTKLLFEGAHQMADPAQLQQMEQQYQQLVAEFQQLEAIVVNEQGGQPTPEQEQQANMLMQQAGEMEQQIAQLQQELGGAGGGGAGPPAGGGGDVNQLQQQLAQLQQEFAQLEQIVLNEQGGQPTPMQEEMANNLIAMGQQLEQQIAALQA
ncbi:unnamed protein product, partial [Amoebophrya sp. A120]